MSLAFIEFEARILGLSLETKIFLIRNMEEQKKEGQSHIWRRASALPKNEFCNGKRLVTAVVATR